MTQPMMRNIIAITVLSSLIGTFAAFDVVAVLTKGGPLRPTQVFATYAFTIGILSGDMPLGASVSLFMLPFLAVAAAFVLRGVIKRGSEVRRPTPSRRAGRLLRRPASLSWHGATMQRPAGLPPYSK